jgi:hypothetical protein
MPSALAAELPILQPGELEGDLAQLGFLELELARLPLDAFVALLNLVVTVLDLLVALQELMLMLLQARVLLANVFQHASGQRSDRFRRQARQVLRLQVAHIEHAFDDAAMLRLAPSGLALSTARFTRGQ